MISSVKCFWRLKNILSTISISCLPIPPPQKKKLGIAVARFFYRPQYKQHLNNVIDCSNNIMRVKNMVQIWYTFLRKSKKLFYVTITALLSYL